ncbi:MAG: DUF3592 domain-containing protein [Alphaproteobacteria bacterium]|nr:MAG: DUF3592 domain-containing protein [Alphaproteobacteria bacterium]
MRTLPDGRRQISWRMWVLVFVAPVLMLAAAAFFALQSLIVVSSYQRTEGEVVRVYDWEGWNPLDGETRDYSPVFRYEFAPGDMTEASTGQSSPNWNFEIGSRHTILFDPAQKTDVKLPGFEQLWALPVTIGVLGAILVVPALLAAAALLRWKRRGREARA